MFLFKVILFCVVWFVIFDVVLFKSGNIFEFEIWVKVSVELRII